MGENWPNYDNIKLKQIQKFKLIHPSALGSREIASDPLLIWT